MKNNRSDTVWEAWGSSWDPFASAGRAAAGSPLGGDPPGRPKAGRKLESSNNTVTHKSFEIVPNRCHSRVCPRCGPRLGWETRQILLSPENLAKFPRPALLTLTVGHERFDSAECAYGTITEGRFVSRLMRSLGFRDYVWVLEFHQGQAENGFSHRGWPHWHILIDLSGIHGRDGLGRLVKRAWRLWRDTWHLGGLKLQAKKGVREPAHAVNYITKYLMKPGYIPGWFQKLKGQRMCQGSRSMGRLCFRSGGRGGEGKRKNKERRILAERVSECGQVSRVLERSLDKDSGEMTTHCLGILPVCMSDWANMALSSEEHAKIWRDYGINILLWDQTRPGSQRCSYVINTDDEHDRRVERRGWDRIKAWVGDRIELVKNKNDCGGQPPVGIMQRLRYIRDWLQRSGYFVERERLIVEKREELLAA